MAGGNMGYAGGGVRRVLGLGLGLGLVLVCGVAGCAGTPDGEGGAADVSGGADAAGAQAGAAGTSVEGVASVGGERVFVPGPWVRVYSVRDADSKRVRERERRSASEVGADGRWQVRFERAPVGTEQWTLERTLTMTRTADGVAMVRLDDAAREMVYAFEPSLVLAPGVVAGKTEARATTTQGGDVGEAIATVVALAMEDGMPRVRTTLTLVQGRTRVERVSELTLGMNGSVRERNERSVRWGRIRVDHADEVLEEVGE